MFLTNKLLKRFSEAETFITRTQWDFVRGAFPLLPMFEVMLPFFSSVPATTSELEAQYITSLFKEVYRLRCFLDFHLFSFICTQFIEGCLIYFCLHWMRIAMMCFHATSAQILSSGNMNIMDVIQHRYRAVWQCVDCHSPVHAACVPFVHRNCRAGTEDLGDKYKPMQSRPVSLSHEKTSVPDLLSHGISNYVSFESSFNHKGSLATVFSRSSGDSEQVLTAPC